MKLTPIITRPGTYKCGHEYPADKFRMPNGTLTDVWPMAFADGTTIELTPDCFSVTLEAPEGWEGVSVIEVVK